MMKRELIGWYKLEGKNVAKRAKEAARNSSASVSQNFIYTALSGIFILWLKYETVGDVRAEVDAAFASHNLRTARGSLHPYTRALTFGLIDSADSRAGDAYCLLPDGGWSGGTYMPDRLKTNEDECLNLKVIKGAGRLALPREGEYCIDITTDVNLPKVNGSRSFHLINPHDELLVVRASSTFNPTNPTDISYPGDGDIDDSWLLPAELTYTHDQTFKPTGVVELRLI